MAKKYRWPFLIVVAMAVVALDRLSKMYAASHLEPLEGPTPLGFFALRYCENEGLAFGTLQGLGVYLAPVSVLAAIFLVVCYATLPDRDNLSRLAIALILGGALGNLYDRIVLRYVIDFIYVRIWPFPFNIADSGISVGAVGLILTSIFGGRD